MSSGDGGRGWGSEMLLYTLAIMLIWLLASDLGRCWIDALLGCRCSTTLQATDDGD